MIEFLLNDRPVQLENAAPTMSVLDWLRTKKGLTGTKEGCASGDCGACTVIIGKPQAKLVKYYTVNACLQFLGNLHGCHLLTIEAFTRANAPLMELHPAQRAMVECHGSQCGFCTPGFIMSMIALYHNHQDYPGDDAAIHALGGNLCRCTGYRPILEACEKMFSYQKVAMPHQQAAQAFFATPKTQAAFLQEDENLFLLPQSIAEFIELKKQHKHARLVAGGTDLALSFSQQLAPVCTLISVQQISQLQQNEVTEDGLMLGAAVTYKDLTAALLHAYPEASEMLQRLGSKQIRNAGTLGGSLANASPIGDPAPLLIALQAKIELAGSSSRWILAEEFFTGYRQTRLNDDEVIARIFIPARKEAQQLYCYKVSKRIEDDISSVLMAVSFELKNNTLLNVCTGFGGMAAVPARGKNLEQYLTGKEFSLQLMQDAAKTIEQDFQPMTDVRASSQYRLSLCQNLLQRMFLEQSLDATTRVKHAAL